MTEALLPWLSEQKVTLWARDPAKARRLFPNATLAPLDAQAPEDATVVVAAPLNEQELTSLLEKNPRPWIDLREKTAPCGSNAAARLTLSDLYHEGSQHQDQNSDLRQQILHEIQELAHKRTHQAWFRPQGWEDVCAS